METKASSKEGRFSPEVERALRQAGWYEGRIVPESQLEQWYAFKYECVPGYHRITPAALTVLREFGGLFIEQDAPGVTCYRESFRIDPLATLGLKESVWGAFEWLIEDSLFPLGVTGGSQDDIIAISGCGKVFLISNLGTLHLAGLTFTHALNSQIVGYMSLPMYFEHYDRKWSEAAQVQAAVNQLYSD